MFKLGVFRLEDFRPDPPGLTSRLRWMLIRNRISLRLLRTAVPAAADEIAVFEALMQGLRLNSGVYRATFHDRFRELDRFVNEILAERFASDAPLDVQDWAASDCLTSSEWAASLLPLFPNARLAASDLTLFVIEVNFGERTVIMERDGHPVQYISPRFLVNVNRPEQRPRVLTCLLIRLAQPAIAEIESGLRIPPEWFDSDSVSLSLLPFAVRKLPMVHPEAVAFRERNATASG